MMIRAISSAGGEVVREPALRRAARPARVASTSSFGLLGLVGFVGLLGLVALAGCAGPQVAGAARATGRGGARDAGADRAAERIGRAAGAAADADDAGADAGRRRPAVAADASRPLPAGTERLGPRPASPPKAIDPSVRASLIDWKLGLNNAAVRDRELEGLVRNYLKIARDVFMHFRAAKAGPGEQGGYDPMPAWRFQARSAPRLLALAVRAALLREHLVAYAEAHGIELVEPPDPGARSREDGPPPSPTTAVTRPERLAVFAALCGCIYEDAWTRKDHGAALVRLRGEASGPLTDAERAELMNREVAMLRTTMRCTSLTGQLRPPRGG